MAEEEVEVTRDALAALCLPKEFGSLQTVADLPDMRTVTLIAALYTLSKELEDKALEDFTNNLLLLSRSRKRKGVKELINLFKAARTRTYVQTLVTRAKRILVGEHGGIEATE